MTQHPLIAAQILDSVPFLEDVVPFVLYHHERVDGAGYITGLRGGEIPLEARILAVADSYDAMTSERPYRRALPKDKAMQELTEGSGSQFDSEVACVFVSVLSERMDCELPEPEVPGVDEVC